MTEMKKQYQSPTMKVVQVQQTQIICASTKSMYEWDLGDGGFEEL